MVFIFDLFSSRLWFFWCLLWSFWCLRCFLFQCWPPPPIDYGNKRLAPHNGRFRCQKRDFHYFWRIKKVLLFVSFCCLFGGFFGYFGGYTRSVLYQKCIGTKFQTCGRPHHLPLGKRRFCHVFCDSKQRFFSSKITTHSDFFDRICVGVWYIGFKTGLILALKWSLFCHFVTPLKIGQKRTFLLSECPVILTFWDRFYETFCLPRLTKSVLF